MFLLLLVFPSIALTNEAFALPQAPASLSFAPATTWATGVAPAALVVGDFNGDGKPDLATADYGPWSGGASILLGNGAGGFGLANILRFGVTPRSVAAGDLNGDGRLDLVVGDYDAGILRIFLGDGAGGFTVAGSYSAGGNYSLFGIAIADLNGDGKPDLATANFLRQNVTVFLGDGLGGFGSPQAFGAGTQPIDIVAADFNGDGKIDLATANIGSNNISLLLGNGAGGFAAASNFAVGLSPSGLAAADLNGDGKPDLAVANWDSKSVSVLLGGGTGGFGPAADVPVGDTLRRVGIADFNGDGRLDLVTTNVGSPNVTVLLGNGSGAFGSPNTFGLAEAPGAVAVGDFNGDGRPDIAVTLGTLNSVALLLNTSQSTDQTPPLVVVPAGLSLEAASAAGAPGTFDASANDNVDGPLPVTCSPASGSTFDLGTTTVTCTATDAAGNSGSTSFTVIVRLKGDINGDGSIDLADVVLGLQLFSRFPLVGSQSPVNNEASLPLDNKNKVGIADVLYVLQIVAWLRSTGPDAVAPLIPAELTATGVSANQIDLSWTASTDNMGVTGYKIYRGSTYLKSVTGTSTSDAQLNAETQYCYTVSAYDAAGNESGQSLQACYVTQSLAAVTIKGKATASGASINFFTLNANGSKGGFLGNALTDANGEFSVTLMVSTTYSILAEASGGSYVNEISGRTDSLLSTDILTAVFSASATGVAVTPLTHMAAARAMTLAAAGMPLASAVEAANIGVAQQYQLMNVLEIFPVAINDAAHMAISGREERNYGIVLAAFTQVAADLNVRPIDLATAFAEDMGDGILDSLSDGNPIQVPTIAGQIATTERMALSGPVITLPPGAPINRVQEAIDRLLVSDANLTNLAGKNISTVPVTINPTAQNNLRITTTVLRAWFEGKNGETVLNATGGTPPYIWSVPPGTAPGSNVLPNWLGLVPNGVLRSGTLPPLLAPGSTMSISAPFVLMCQDSSTPPQRQLIQFTATIIKAPPRTIPVQGTCIAGTQFVTQVARAEGGVPPYYFKSPSFMYGAPPLGTIIDLNGNLRGTCPANAGVFNFPVAAVDSIGADPLEYTSLVVEEPATCIFTYTDWSACRSDNTQTRTVISGSPEGCVGTPVLARACIYVPPPPPPPSCSYSIVPTSASFNSHGGNTSVAVSASGGCNWTAASNASWITITSGNSGTGDGTVNYSVAANTGASSRTGTTTIAGQTFTVTQSAYDAGSSPFQGILTGSLTGNCTDVGPITSGVFAMTIDANGQVRVTASACTKWRCSDLREVTGSVSSGGVLSTGNSNGSSVTGNLSIIGGTTLSGTGAWQDVDYVCAGNWSGGP
jgi:hypothetical protein